MTDSSLKVLQTYFQVVDSDIPFLRVADTGLFVLSKINEKEMVWSNYNLNVQQSLKYSSLDSTFLIYRVVADLIQNAMDSIINIIATDLQQQNRAFVAGIESFINPEGLLSAQFCQVKMSVNRFQVFYIQTGSTEAPQPPLLVLEIVIQDNHLYLLQLQQGAIDGLSLLSVQSRKEINFTQYQSKDHPLKRYIPQAGCSGKRNLLSQVQSDFRHFGVQHMIY